MTDHPPRRLFARFPCDLPVEIFSPVSQTKLADARLFDVGMGGGNVSSDFNLQRATAYEFRMRFGKEQLAVLGRVVWSAPTDRREPGSNRYGVTFSLTASQEAVMAGLVAHLNRV